MKVNWSYIKAFALLALVVFLYSFSSKRNATRRISEVKIEEDMFLKEHITLISKSENGNYKLGLRVIDFEVELGKIENLEFKIKNFKAFYKKAMKDEKLDAYQSVSLQFDNQVVCTKK